jgi:hypothetical protein
MLDDGFDQVGKGRAGAPSAVAMVYDDGNDRRETLELRVLLTTAFPDSHHVAEQLECNPAIGRALVLEQEVHERRARLDAHRKQ